MAPDEPSEPTPSSFADYSHAPVTDLASTETLPAAPRGERLLCVLAVVLGLAFDVLAAHRSAGVGLTIGLVLAMGACVALHGRNGLGLASRNRLVVLALLAAVALCFSLRTSSALHVTNAVALAVGALFLSIRFVGRRLRDARIRDLVVGAVETTTTTVIRSMAVLVRALRPGERSAGRPRRIVFFDDHGRDIAIGCAIAIPLLAIFIGLFAASDAGFERLVSNAADVDVDTDLFGSIASHLWFVVWSAALTLAGLIGALWSVPATPLAEDSREWTGPAVLWIVLGSTCALFATFVAVQASYLFGGAKYLERKAGLTAADYARQGFYELIVVAGLTVVVVLLARASFHERGSSARSFRVLAPLLAMLTIVVLGSAMARLVMYAHRFGLTEQRITAVVILVWIALVLAWMAARVALGRSMVIGSFGTVVALVLVVALNVANPQAIAARTIMDGRGVDGHRSIDVDYLMSLDTDAAATIVHRLRHVPSVQRDTLRRAAERDVARDRRHARDWRSWNLSRAQARDVVN